MLLTAAKKLYKSKRSKDTLNSDYILTVKEKQILFVFSAMLFFPIAIAAIIILINTI